MEDNLYYGYTREIHHASERIIEQEIYMRANRIFDYISANDYATIDDWQNLLIEGGDDWGDIKDIFEYYFISDWLAQKLIEAGEPILDSEILDYPIWGRTCTGQAIILDGTIQEIVKGL